jgi:hypothetical protein
MSERYIYQVGDKVFHSDFGEGLIVDIRDRPFYDILEVVFSGGVKRLTSIHPLLRPKPILAEEPPPKSKRRPRRKKGDVDANGSRLSYLTLDETVWALLDRAAKRKADPLIDYRLHLEAEELVARRGFENLVCIDRLTGSISSSTRRKPVSASFARCGAAACLPTKWGWERPSRRG